MSLRPSGTIWGDPVSKINIQITKKSSTVHWDMVGRAKGSTWAHGGGKLGPYLRYLEHSDDTKGEQQLHTEDKQQDEKSILNRRSRTDNDEEAKP